MKFSIVTPSFRSSRWLRLCIPSVADQEGVEVEHIVQDSCSDDGTQDWLAKDKRVKAVIEKDQGMYDAVNRGLKRAAGEVLAYLNCDEQYLPGALRTVARYFEEHPDIEVVFGDGIVVGPDGSYMCHRRALVPGRAHTLVSGNLAIMSCGAFFRRKVIAERNLFFNTRYRDDGDAYWVLSLVERGVPMGLLNAFTSLFTNTGDNMNMKANAQRERRERFEKAPAWARLSRSAIVAHHRLRKLMAGHYTQRPFEYAAYAMSSPEKRVVFQVMRPTAVWKR
jgi:glycosyltransferase involved in cell wall biosynthesis